MNIDPKKEVQRIPIGGRTYVLIAEEMYEGLQRRLDGLHAALQVQRSRANVSTDFVDTLVRGQLTPEEARKILQAATFGRRLALLREFRKLDQIVLARIAEVSQATISKLENDETKRPSLEVIQRILKALNLPDLASYTLFGKEIVPVGTKRALARV
jgi:DNA-binding XRE family transcriptional regulator